MATLRNTSPVLGERVASSLLAQVWPRDVVNAGAAVSVRRLVERFGAAGVSLDALRRDTRRAWTQVDRGALVAGIRTRLLDPAVIFQNDLPFCGPASIAFELARRDPARYVETIAAVYADGGFTTPNGRVIRAEQELLDGPMPSPSAAGIATDPADWVFTATLRDDENLILDVVGDDSKDPVLGGPAGATFWGEMCGWTRDVLGLRPELVTCVVDGELAALRLADRAVRAGGMAFLNIDAGLIQYGAGAAEEDAWFERTSHAGAPSGASPPRLHSKDDGLLDHWVVYLGGLDVADDAGDDSASPIALNLWSWAAEYRVSGTAAAMGEYLWAVVLGWP